MNLTLDFKAYEAKNNWATLGTVKELAGKGGSIGFIKQNWTKKDKNVAVLIERKDGTSVVVSCHSALSPKLRAGEINLKQLAGLSIIGTPDNEDGTPGVRLIVLPGTGGTQKFAVDAIKVAEMPEESAEFVPSELIAF